MTTTTQPRTRYARDGFRETLCPICGQWVAVTSYQDDTRWRVARHGPTVANKIRCDGSGELVAAAELPVITITKKGKGDAR